jgi:hypothetical protein
MVDSRAAKDDCTAESTSRRWKRGFISWQTLRVLKLRHFASFMTGAFPVPDHGQQQSGEGFHGSGQEKRF